jgi:enoyl-CoA hydratase/carnithine racemase
MVGDSRTASPGWYEHDMAVGVEVQGHVGVVELQDPPHNFLGVGQVRAVADALHGFEIDVRAAVLCAQGRSFCAGANFAGEGATSTGDLYEQAARLCASPVPFVAAVQGPAIGGGLGLAMTASYRVTCPEARFSANFVKLGIHQGFGLSVTLPETIGPSRAALVLLGGRRFKGDEATELGLADECVPSERVRERAIEVAAEIATGAPLAIRAIHATLRAGLADRVREATSHEAAEQDRLFATSDAREGIRAVTDRREGRFTGR